MATFLNTKLSGDFEPTIMSLSISRNGKDALEKIGKLNNELYRIVEAQSLYLDTDWEIHLSMISATYDWLTGSDLNTILQTYDIFPGNFVKDMVKLNNIAQDIVKTAEVLNKIELVEKLNNIESKLLRDSVSLDSLYIKKI